jgi:hypothetical protein
MSADNESSPPQARRATSIAGFSSRNTAAEVTPRQSVVNLQRSPSAARRDALLDAVWDASAVHTAATAMALIDYLIANIRQHPHDALGLERDAHWLEGLRARQADATLFVGRDAVNQIIDRIVDALCDAPPPSIHELPTFAAG